MQAIEYRTVDKSAWHDGPWQAEPDKRQWLDPETGYPCLIVRGPSGALCGYVGVSSGHPDFETDCEHVDVEAHGGLTFSGKCSHGPEESAICHKVEAGENDEVWWLGFDCAHSGDLCPKWDGASEFETYKDFSYVQDQVESLARQLREREKRGA